MPRRISDQTPVDLKSGPGISVISQPAAHNKPETTAARTDIRVRVSRQAEEQAPFLKSQQDRNRFITIMSVTCSAVSVGHGHVRSSRRRRAKSASLAINVKRAIMVPPCERSTARPAAGQPPAARVSTNPGGGSLRLQVATSCAAPAATMPLR